MAIAAEQHSIISRRQLERAGLSTDVVDRYIRIGRMMRRHRGVYQLGASGQYTHLMAATLAFGGATTLSHRSCAWLWSLYGESNDDVEVTVAGHAKSRAGIRVHRAQLRPDEITTRAGMRVTTPARTLYDLAGLVRSIDAVRCGSGVRRSAMDDSRIVMHRDVERALAEALAQRLTTRRAMLAFLAGHHGHGAGLLRELLESDVKPALTRSEAEELFLVLIRRGGVTDPAVNVIVEGFEVDFFWRAERHIVEVDGHRFHASKRAFENDRRRDAVLAAAGYTVMRVTWDQIRREPEAVLVRLVMRLCQSER